VEVIAGRKREGLSLWRVSSTLFSHVASDQELRSLLPSVREGEGERGEGEKDTMKYKPILAGDQVMEELRAIKLGQ
jgi:hypothetical protein